VQTTVKEGGKSRAGSNRRRGLVLAAVEESSAGGLRQTIAAACGLVLAAIEEGERVEGTRHRRGGARPPLRRRLGRGWGLADGRGESSGQSYDGENERERCG
jgi:hypothetical protein